MDDLFFFEKPRLNPLADSLTTAYASNDPFPHAVIDDLLPKEVADKIAGEFPTVKIKGFKQPDNAFQSGKRERIQEGGYQGVTPYLRHMLNEFSSHAFLEFLEKLTGISGLIPDPSFNGGGLHQVLNGGKLAVHADFNLDPYRKLVRRVNVLVYFNPDWKDEFGGHLELWDKKVKRCVKRIAPMLNRCVVFSTTDTSFHGHPDPLNLPPGRARNSFAFYYYTAIDPKNMPKEHNTLWRARPGTDDPSGEGDRIYKGAMYEGLRNFSKKTLKPLIPKKLLSRLKEAEH